MTTLIPHEYDSLPLPALVKRVKGLVEDCRHAQAIEACVILSSYYPETAYQLGSAAYNLSLLIASRGHDAQAKRQAIQALNSVARFADLDSKPL